MKRNYLPEDIGLEPEDLAFFRVVATICKRPLSDVVERAITIGAAQMRFDLAPIVPEGRA